MKKTTNTFRYAAPLELGFVFQAGELVEPVFQL